MINMKILFASGLIGLVSGLLISQRKRIKMLEKINDDMINQIDECCETIEHNTEKLKELRFERTYLREEERELLLDLNNLIEQLEEDS